MKKGIMSSTSSNQKNVIVILVVAIAVLAAAMVFLIWQTNNSKANTATLPAEQETQIKDASSAMQQAVQAQNEFDISTAQQVTGTPEEWVTKYYEACNESDWQTAFDLQPTARKSATTVDAFASQLSGYGITGYEIVSTDEPSEDSISITVDQKTGQFGTFTSIWEFVKSDGNWYVKSKSVAGMR